MWNQNSYSKETIKLEILGSEKAALGEEVEYSVKFKNNGTVRAENPELSFEFPKNSILGEGVERIQRMSSVQLRGDIYPGEERIFTFSARLLGKEGEAKTAKAVLTFQPKGLNTRNEVSTTFTTIVEKASLNFTFDLPSSIGSGKQFSFKINYWSNIPYPLSDLTCQIQYPSGFDFISAKPNALDQVQWNIANLNEGEGGRIEISGKVSGEAKEQKIFKAQIGIWRDGNFILLKEAIKGIEISTPDIYISQNINNSPQYTAVPGDILRYEIFFRNIGEEPLTDLVLISRLEGKSFDFYSIKAPEGDFGKGDSSIIWDGKKVPQLRYLDKGEEGKVEFWVELKSNWPVETLADKNPEIKNRVTISQLNESFVNKVSSTLKGEQEISLDSKYFISGGSVPLVPGEANTFAVVWKLSNFYNDVNNVKFRAVLPEGVIFTGKVWPEENSGLTYDSQSREILWQAGDLGAGLGILTEPKVCAFQLSAIPKAEDVGKDFFTLGAVQISGEDKWTKTSLYSEIQSLQIKVKENIQ